ncbi:serine/threonine-protein kinase [Schlesneria paludicola]|uniref:serine/threonine-protein kinase n=1 Tax=Schlesneria paludicola TaxID=360056 RepID=UPI00029A5EAA|nr:serine/threonine-protein kinase [Schlesneria paludicola]
MRCNDAHLKQLLVADDSSAEFRSTANHVETCPRCQQRLLELSDDHELLSEVRETLLARGDDTAAYQGAIGSSVVISIEGGSADEPGAECEPVSLDFLSPPSHPEMLGRIGRYEVERVVGAGGMGVVLKGFDTELHRVVAIKVLKPHLANHGAARRRFSREAQSAAAVVHEHVIPIYDVQPDGDTPFLVMQYVPGQSLQSRVDERGPLDTKEVLRIASQAAAGLAAAHAQGLVHRDVKPANILLEESLERVLISDFGLARTVDDATLTRTGIVAGTPHYMSPEQASGQPIDHRSDLFSLGSVIYFMCTGRPPFRAEHAMAILNRICHDPHRPLDEVNHDVPAELAETVDRLLSKNPGDRYRDAREVEQRLSSLLAHLQQGRRSRRLHWHRRWLQRRSTIVNVVRQATIVTACLLGGIGLSRWFAPGPTNPTSPPVIEFPRDSPSSPTDPFALHLDRVNPSVHERVNAEQLFTSAPDEWQRELDQTRTVLDAIENRWNPTDSIRQTTSDDAWQRELHDLKTALQAMEQLAISPKDKSQTPVP